MTVATSSLRTTMMDFRAPWDWGPWACAQRTFMETTDLIRRVNDFGERSAPEGYNRCSTRMEIEHIHLFFRGKTTS
ncbi:hypothetical protein EVAR_64032_1 [Eumeta japonica]|uniref:Uncharacterized protein n=1 Tax=Eumeta variegata TaxID=151549 RepID=A0A4C1Z4E9_EUMVA|nr:hypothetical protein EVAR_64032_1 [Eumeta japonica]